MDNHNYKKSSTYIKILLLTHGTVDNLGDQTIEICAEAMIRAVMKNLRISSDKYEVIRRDADFINERSLSTQTQNQSETAEYLIKKSDVIIFGGAPMFNYLYEGFAERTARTMDIIKKYSKPVIFSAIGVENYEQNNPICIQLRNSLNNSCVRMITTRDNFEALQKFTEDTNIPIAKVSDSAVHISTIFKDYISKPQGSSKKKIGLFVIRGNAFKDNKIEFDQEQAIKLWLNIAVELEARGYDYEFLTSGSYTDELLLERLIVEHGVNEQKCITNLNTPEDLVRKISSYDGMISCRLHPSIISYSLKVPTVALMWNNKVGSFYKNIGYSERVIQATDVKCKDIIERLEAAMREGVLHREEFLLSSYNSLFCCMKDIFAPDDVAEVFSYKELTLHLPLFKGSDLKEKLDWKFARTYKAFNNNLSVCSKRRRMIQKNKEAYEELLQKYNALEKKYTEACGEVSKLKELMMLRGN